MKAVEERKQNLRPPTAPNSPILSLLLTRLRGNNLPESNAEMLDAGQKQTLFFSLVPYVSVALYDSWLHERSRQVPLAEQGFHAATSLALGVLMFGLFFDHPALLIPAIAGFGLTSCIDELGFHGGLPWRERRLHFVAYTCFAGFVAIAAKIGALS